MRNGSSSARARGGAALSPTPDSYPSEVSEPISDAILLERCRAGSDEAWDVLIDRYERLVFSVAVRNGLSHDDALDVSQITFSTLLDSLAKLRQDESLAWWLMTVARRQSWRIRHRGRREIAVPEVEVSPEDPLVNWERVASVQQALQQLGNPCRDLLIALYFDPESPTYAEIARRLGRSIGGIGPMRARCLARVRVHLADGGWG